MKYIFKMLLTQVIKVLQISSVICLLITLSTCQPLPPDFVLLDRPLHEESTDFVPMLFHDPRFPKRQPQMMFVPLERKQRTVAVEKQNVQNMDFDDLSMQGDEEHPHYEDDHHHVHHHYHHDHYETDADEQQ